MELRETVSNIREKLTEWWEKTEKKDRARFLIITGVCIVVIIVAVVLLSRTQYAVLYRDMDPGDAGEVLAVLREQGVSYRTEGAGTILVPAGQVDQLIMGLAAQGYPKSGYTYEIYARGGGLGSTDAERRTYERFDLQERLATTLRQFAPSIIKDARVEIAVQDSSSVILASQVTPTTASVMLTLLSELSDENIAAIEHLVAASVQGLNPENVYITDQNLRRLNHVDRNLLNVGTDYEKIASVRDDFVHSILQLLIPIFGSDNVRVSGQVALSFDEHAIESVVFAPVVDDEGIDISIREISETARGYQAGGEVGIDPNGAAPVYPEGWDGVSDYTNITREINREVNETRENIVYAKGEITDLSFSIAINSIDLSDENRSADAVKNLVANVVGLSRQEFDRITVEFRRFDGIANWGDLQAQHEGAMALDRWLGFFKTIGLYVIIGACLLVIIIRLFKLISKPRERAVEEAVMMALEQAEAESRAEAEEAGMAEMAEADPELENLVSLVADPGGEEITISKTDSRHRVEEFIDKNPDAVANLLRNWLSEEKKPSTTRKR